MKIPLTDDISTMKIKKLTSNGDGTWKEKWTTYQEYLNLLGPKERAAKIKATRYTTFLVFHSGNTICSGLTREFMEPVYEYFIELIRKGFDQIEERLDTTFQGLSIEEELAAMMI